MKYVIATTLLLLVGALAFAKQVPVDVVRQNHVPIAAEAKNILPNTEVDLTLPFSATDESNVENGLPLTANEKAVMHKVLSGQVLSWSDRANYVSLLNKQVKEKALSSDERKYLLGWKGSENTYNKSIYLSRKKILDL